MSTEIKPGDTIVTVQDAPTLLGRTIPQGTHGRVLRSGPPIVGPYSVYARFPGDRPGDGRQVRPGDVAVVPDAPSTEITLQLNDATIIRHTTDPDLSDLYDAGWVKVPTTPAPLDPALVQAGDTVKAHVEFADPTVTKPYDIAGEVIADPHGSLWLGPVMLVGEDGYTVTLTAHQPAPKPEWKPGTTGTATVRGIGGVKVLRQRYAFHEDGCVDQWASDEHVDGALVHVDADVTDFVPDETRPLPSREAMAEAMHDDRLPGGEPRLTYLQRLILADAIIANQRGESR
jgi:hypothetical protein